MSGPTLFSLQALRQTLRLDQMKKEIEEEIASLSFRKNIYTRILGPLPVHEKGGFYG